MHRITLPLLLIVAAVSACTTIAPEAADSASTSSASATTDTDPPEPPSIVPEDEPGPALLVRGRVVDADSGAGIPGAELVVYQTDQTGTYQPSDSGDESTARIRGEFVSDDAGGFAFATVQPGEYPDQPPGNRHIHLHRVSADGYDTTGLVLLFDDNVRADVRSWAEETGFGIVVPVEGTEETGFEVWVEIPLVRLEG